MQLKSYPGHLLILTHITGIAAQMVNINSLYHHNLMFNFNRLSLGLSHLTRFLL